MTLATRQGVPLPFRAPLAGEALERPAQGSFELAPDDERVDDGREEVAALELVVELELDRHLVAARHERDLLRAAQALVLDGQRLPGPRLVRADDLHHPAASAGQAVPHQPACR